MTENKTHKPWKKRKKKPNSVVIITADYALRRDRIKKLKEDVLQGLKEGCLVLNSGIHVEFVRRNR